MAHYSSQVEWKLGQLGGYRSVPSPKRSGSDTTISECGGGAFVCGKEIEDGTHPRPRRRIRVRTDATRVTVWFHNFVAITHGQPDEEETPTNAQLSALNVIVIVQLGSPHADFAVFTPYARKTTRAHFTAYLPQPDGSWLAKEIPGPTNYQAWLFCWSVFRVACLHEMPLDRYQRKIEKLATQWPTAWHLVCLHFDRFCPFVYITA